MSAASSGNSSWSADQERPQQLVVWVEGLASPLAISEPAFSFQRQRLINSRAYANGESEVAIKIPIKHTVENGTGPSSAPDRGVNGTRRDDVVAEAGNETENENENDENDEEEDEEDEEGPYTPFDPPCKRSCVWAGLG